MYCPQCGTETQGPVQYCRTCGSNLKVIGKAVSLSEAIARSDRGPVLKIKEMMQNLKVDHVTEEVSRALEKMNQEIAQSSTTPRPGKERRPWPSLRRKKTAAERREQHITKGVVSLFSGAGLTTFLYFLSSALVLKLPPEILAQIPFELYPVVKVIWLLGLLPATSGLGHIIAGLLIRPDQEPQLQPQLDQVGSPPRELTDRPLSNPVPFSVTDHTTNLLDSERVTAPHDKQKAQTGS